MSWTEASFAPEPMRRRSRSRSPDRRPYERFDREQTRDREWAEYERERAEWEYRRANGIGTRGRSRSPGSYDDRRPKRRRSMSPPFPQERDRYDPRSRHDPYDDYRGPSGRYSPPPRPYRQYSPPRSRGPADPYDMDFPANFRYFNDWYRATHPASATDDDAQAREADTSGTPINLMKKRYNEYRRFMTGRQVQILFDHHKTSAWFLERYGLSPQQTQLRIRVRKHGLEGKIDEFITNLQQGKYDPVLEMDSVVPTMSNNGTSWKQNGDHGKEDNADGDMGGMVDESRVDDDMDINMFDQEASGEGAGGGVTSLGPTANNGALKASGGASAVEEVSAEPEGVQIMIRTIPPDIGRVKIEEVCSKIPGFMYLALGDPMQKRNYYRCGWIRFEDDVDVNDVVAKLSEAKIDGFRMQVSHSTKPFTSRCRVTPAAAAYPERIQIDLENVRKLVSIMEEEAEQLAKMSLEGEETAKMESNEPKDRGTVAVEARVKELITTLEERFAGTEPDKLDAKKNSLTLDLYLAYLRHAFHCCYYCAVVAYHDEELLRKCIKHVRGSAPPTGDSKEERWIEWLNSKIALLIDRENVDPVTYGGKDYQKELSKVCEPHLKHEEEGKFRCNLCTKLFKAESFVEKHIANKHPQIVADLEEIPFFNSFALDPHRIQPFTHAPPPTGNQAIPPAAYGLRGVGIGSRDMNGGAGYYDTPPRAPYSHHSYAPPVPPPMSMGGGGYYSEYNPQPYAPARRYSPPGGRRRLSERVGERMADSPLVLTGGEGLPPRPVTVAEPMSERGRESGPATLLLKIKEDPRAAQGRKVSYMDMDEVAEGDIELNY